MINFEYTRASDIADAVRRSPARIRQAKFIAGGTNLIDLMKEDVERPTRLIDITHLPLGRSKRRAAGGLRIGALVPNTDLAYHPIVEQPLSAAGERDPRGRVAAIAQHGVDRRQSAAADALLVFLRHRDAVQQTRARQRLLGASTASTGSMRSSARASLHRDASVRHVRRARGARRDGPRAPDPPANVPSRSRDFHRLPGDTPQRDTNLQPGEIITAIELPAQGFASHYSYLKLRDRAVLCVRAGLGRGRARARRRHDPGGAPGARRRRAQAVARSRRPRRLLRGQNRPKDAVYAQCRRSRCCATPRASRHNAFKIDLAAQARSSAR